MFQPLEQFNIYLIHQLNLFGLTTLNLTNYLLVSLMLLICVSMFCVFPLKYSPLVPTNWNIVLENIYNFLVKLFSQHVNNYHSLYYFPIVSTIFMLVLFANLLGLMPYNFTITSHIFTTLTLSLTMFLAIIIISLYYNKLNYFKFFVPKGMDDKPLLKYFLIFIEVISYIIRPFSLAIRLFANMLAGHTLMYILNTFLVYVTNKKIVLLFVLPMLIIFMVFMLEFAIAFIQAYVFTTLLVIYINDIYNISH